MCLFVDYYLVMLFKCCIIWIVFYFSLCFQSCSILSAAVWCVLWDFGVLNMLFESKRLR